ncbi:MAG: crossover junction endodeoxyribonuclease RuvC [bacterium]|nr:crossover junction endodeoxyribonuclease RuvC [bacterium]
MTCTTALPQRRRDIRVLGIDPGTTRIGYGIIVARGAALTHVRSELVQFPASTGAERLHRIAEAIDTLLRTERPDCVSIERLFVTRNQRTAMSVAEARGVIMAAVAAHQIPLIELTPSAVKLAVTGDGRASKAAVARMVGYLLKERFQVVDDITDALAIAIAGAGTLSFGGVDTQHPHP